ncbi:MAG: DUF1295 domain-containing protein [Prolixibacteraceae bacterium]|nr:DUF1295 domain-containing protein [Prolixibacteraceae bacterium]
MGIVNKKRGKSIEDPELYKYANKTKMFIFWYTSLIGMIVSGLFIPIHSGLTLIVGSILFSLGILINIIAMFSFSTLPQIVNTKGIYRLSRNPMYVGGFIYLLGLCIMGWSPTIPFALFVFFFLWWILSIHKTVKNEESFLLEKYGVDYIEFKHKTPKCIGFLK